MTTDRRPPYHRRQTKPLPREQLAPTEEPPTRPSTPNALREREDGATTMVPCPLCVGCGMVPPDVAATFEGALEAMKETE